MGILKMLELLIYAGSAIYCGYLLFFALAAQSNQKKKFAKKQTEKILHRSILILIPAYAEDKVIYECVDSFLHQSYPSDRYEICVISDHMKEETNKSLAEKPIRLEIAHFEEGSTKVKALNLGMSNASGFDIAVIMDADNVVDQDFLEEINLAFEQGHKVVQAHRTAKSTETPFQILDAISEEINNSIFRKGHYNVGMSAGLIGSGMAFEFDPFKKELAGFTSVGGFDKELEHVYLRKGCHFHYLPDTFVYDEKIRQAEAFAKQRRRWLSAQFFYFRKFIPQFFPALKEGNIDFCDKVLQTTMPPRVLFLGGLGFISLAMTFIDPGLSLKWWILLILLLISLVISIPKFLWNKKLLYASLYLGQAFILMFLNLFHLKGANKKFIHTPHGA